MAGSDGLHSVGYPNWPIDRSKQPKRAAFALLGASFLLLCFSFSFFLTCFSFDLFFFSSFFFIVFLTLQLQATHQLAAFAFLAVAFFFAGAFRFLAAAFFAGGLVWLSTHKPLTSS